MADTWSDIWSDTWGAESDPLIQFRSETLQVTDTVTAVLSGGLTVPEAVSVTDTANAVLTATTPVYGVIHTVTVRQG